MPGKQHRASRKPATKFAHLKKKISQQKTGQNFAPARPKAGKPHEDKR